MTVVTLDTLWRRLRPETLTDPDALQVRLRGGARGRQLRWDGGELVASARSTAQRNVPATHVPEVLRAVSARRWDLTAGPAVWRLRRYVDRGVAAVTCPTHPHCALVWVGGQVPADVPDDGHVAFHDFDEWRDTLDEHDDIVVAVDDELADRLAMAAAPPRHGRGLWAVQAELVGASTASGRGAVHASPTGAGKTVMVLADWSSRAAHVPRWRGLVLAPRSTLPQWAEEARTHLPAAHVRTDPDEVETTDEGAVLVLTTAQRAANRVEQFTSVLWHDIAVDEADWLANPATQRSRVAHQLRHSAERGFAVTATGQHATDALTAWARGGPAQPPGVLEAAADRLRDHRPSLVIHRAALPVTDEVAHADDELRTRLRAADTGGAALVARTAPRTYIDPDTSGKVRWVAARAAALARGGEQVAVFCDHRDARQVLAGELGSLAVTVGTGERDAVRADALQRFADGDAMVVIVGAGAQRGVNLPQATVAIHADLPWDSSAFTQRNGRVARPGGDTQPRRILVPVVEATLEAQVAELITEGHTATPATVAHHVAAA